MSQELGQKGASLQGVNKKLDHMSKICHHPRSPDAQPNLITEIIQACLRKQAVLSPGPNIQMFLFNVPRGPESQASLHQNVPSPLGKGRD